MKISVLGDIIDTDWIYQITSVRKIYNSGIIKEPKDISAYSFEIRLSNSLSDKIIKIFYDVIDETNFSVENYFNEYKQACIEQNISNEDFFENENYKNYEGFNKKYFIFSWLKEKRLEEANKISLKAEEKIENLRNELIRLWSENQSKIPKLEFV